MTSRPIISSLDQFKALIATDTLENGNIDAKGFGITCGVRWNTFKFDLIDQRSGLSKMLGEEGFFSPTLHDDGIPPKAILLILRYYADPDRVECPRFRARTILAIEWLENYLNSLVQNRLIEYPAVNKPPKVKSDASDKVSSPRQMKQMRTQYFKELNRSNPGQKQP